MRHFFYSAGTLIILSSSAAQAASVYPGCAVPAVKAGRHTFYVDPAKGTKAGDGSAAKPWRTLAEVLDYSAGLVATQGHNTRTFLKGDTSLVAINPNGKIKPGDVIMLMSGNHGDVRILNDYNSDFITVMAGPGQTPVVSSMTVVSSAKWLFQGIKFQGQQPAGSVGATKMVSAGVGDWLGSTQDVAFDNNSFSAVDNPSAWTPQQWLSLPYNYALYMGALSCMTATNNHFYNVNNAIAAATNNSLVQGNIIERMSNDGIDVTASNLTVKGNTIKDGMNDAMVSPFHADAIQGWSLTTKGVLNTNKNVVIDSNFVLKTGSGKSSYLQGITVFNGSWDNLTVSNNVVAVNTYQGIAMAGVQNGSIVNNTVIGTDPSYGTQISVSKGGAQNSNVVVRNNITTVLAILAKDFTVDHNIAASRMTYVKSDGTSAFMASGSFNNTNKIIPAVMQGFVTSPTSTGISDLRLKANSVAQAYGIPDKAPAIDVVGKMRKPSVTAGAYN